MSKMFSFSAPLQLVSTSGIPLTHAVMMLALVQGKHFYKIQDRRELDRPTVGPSMLRVRLQYKLLDLYSFQVYRVA